MCWFFKLPRHEKKQTVGPFIYICSSSKSAETPTPISQVSNFITSSIKSIIIINISSFVSRVLVSIQWGSVEHDNCALPDLGTVVRCGSRASRHGCSSIIYAAPKCTRATPEATFSCWLGHRWQTLAERSRFVLAKSNALHFGVKRAQAACVKTPSRVTT